MDGVRPAGGVRIVSELVLPFGLWYYIDKGVNYILMINGYILQCVGIEVISRHVQDITLILMIVNYNS